MRHDSKRKSLLLRPLMHKIPWLNKSKKSVEQWWESILLVHSFDWRSRAQYFLYSIDVALSNATTKSGDTYQSHEQQFPWSSIHNQDQYLVASQFFRHKKNTWKMNEWIYAWVGGWVNEWINEWMNGWVGGWVNEWMNEWMNGWVGGWVNEWMDEWMVEWKMNEWMDERKKEWMNEEREKEREKERKSF